MSRVLRWALFPLLVTLHCGQALAAETGKDLYKTYCWQCHGMTGNGNGINVRDMSVQPRNHSDAKEMSARSDEDLFKAIKHGGQSINKSVLMPPWDGVLSDDEIHALVRYLRELCQCRHG
ncbi:MAG: c-type cytochrome [Gammaproteobacteria bacterium]|nr:c-type cytochrome [Gammaproteobacteria bacterium]